MSRILREEVSKVKKLAKLKLSEEQIKNHSKKKKKILDYINQLEKIDTTNVPCTTRAIEVTNNFRSDSIQKYKNRMINIISKICEINKKKINIKGKTTEKLGVIGKELAIACEVITSVYKND